MSIFNMVGVCYLTLFDKGTKCAMNRTISDYLILIYNVKLLIYVQRKPIENDDDRFYFIMKLCTNSLTI